MPKNEITKLDPDYFRAFVSPQGMGNSIDFRVQELSEKINEIIDHLNSSSK